jgi:hypothetical protein
VPYTAKAAAAFADICKPLDAGPPVVTIGQGMSDYLPTADDDVAVVEAGPQGGYHIWLATRVKNLHQSGSVIHVGGEIPSLGLSMPSMKVVFTMDPDEGGYCKLFGLRFRIDDGDDLAPLLGRRMKVIVTITDITDDVGVGERWVTLSDAVSE